MQCAVTKARGDSKSSSRECRAVAITGLRVIGSIFRRRVRFGANFSPMTLSHRFPFVALLAVAAVATACSDPDPLSKSHDIVARTVGRDLTGAQLAAWVARSRVPVANTVENGVVIADVWADYQRLAYAGAHDDSLESHFSAAMTAAEKMARVNMFLETLRKPVPRDTATQAAFDSGAHGLYALRHILFAFPPKARQAQKDSVGKLALLVRSQLTPANFVAMAKKYSSDTISASKGGYLGVVVSALINPSVAGIVTALKPDSISKVLRTQIGLDIIQRLSYADAATDYAAAFSRAVNASIDSMLITKAEASANLQVTSNGPNDARAAAANPIAGVKDSTVIATFNNGGKFTKADMLTWVNLMDPSARIQVLKDLPEQPDVVATSFIKNVAARAILLRSADSAKISVSDSVRQKFHTQFRTDLAHIWGVLGVAPEQLADSAKTTAEKEQVAARRIDRFMERGMSGELVMLPVSAPLETVLNATYPATVSLPAVSQVMLKR
jgi:hypothetical protein